MNKEKTELLKDLLEDVSDEVCIGRKCKKGCPFYVSDPLGKMAGCALTRMTVYINNIEEEEEMKEIRHESKKQKVDHPEHYNQTKYECIEEMIHLFGIEAVKNFCKCNIYKYKYRANFKNGDEDLKKADKYMDILIDLEKREPKDKAFTDLPLPRRIFINSFGGCDTAVFGEDDEDESPKPSIDMGDGGILMCMLRDVLKGEDDDAENK